MSTANTNRKNKKKSGIIFWYISIFSFNYITLLFFKFIIIRIISLYYWFLFFCLYNLVKRKTPQNIVIGGAAGALPPVIGWTITTGQISVEPVILFLIIFFWTPSHFWALSLYKAGDYKRAKIPMMPIIAGTQKTKLNIFLYALAMLPITIAPYFFNFASLIYLSISFLMTSYYVFLCYRLFKETNSKTSNIIARKIFIYSIFYLFFIFLMLLIDNKTMIF